MREPFAEVRLWVSGFKARLEQAAEKMWLRDKSLPQRLKPSRFGAAFAALKGRSSTVLRACASFSAACKAVTDLERLSRP